jgi:hypothetical protein
MDLILQCEVKSHMLYTFPRKHFCAGCIVHRLEMADHVRKPDSQAIVAEIKNSETRQGILEIRTRQCRVKKKQSDHIRNLLASRLISHFSLPNCCGSGNFHIFYTTYHILSYLSNIFSSLCLKHYSPSPPLSLPNSYSLLRT